MRLYYGSGGTNWSLQWTINYGYDALDQMVWRSTTSPGYSPVYRFYSFENGQMNLAFEYNNALTQRFVWGPQVDQLLIHELDSASYGSGEIYYPLADQQQTIHDAAKYISSASATKVVVHCYLDAYGSGGWWTNFESSSYDGSLFLYTGRFNDNLTGLQWNLHRWYDRDIGRWMSEDPIGFNGDPTNLYRYVGNSPTNATDPTGLLRRTKGYGHSGAAIAQYTQAWDSFTLSQAPPTDVVLIQRIIVTLEVDRRTVDGPPNSSSFGPMSYYEEVGVIKKGGKRLTVEDTWAYDGDTQPNLPAPQFTREQIVQTGLVIAFCLTDALKAVLSTWTPLQRFSIGHAFWSSGLFPANQVFDSAPFEIWEAEDNWHQLVSTWTKGKGNKLVVDGKPT